MRFRVGDDIPDGIGFRFVIEVDGEPRMVTKDHRPDRLNFKVKAGLITEVTKG